MGQFVKRTVRGAQGASFAAVFWGLFLAVPSHAGMMTGAISPADSSGMSSSGASWGDPSSLELERLATPDVPFRSTSECELHAQRSDVRLGQPTTMNLSRQPGGASSSSRTTQSRLSGDWANAPKEFVSPFEICLCYRIEHTGGRLPQPAEGGPLDPPRAGFRCLLP